MAIHCHYPTGVPLYNLCAVFEKPIVNSLLLAAICEIFCNSLNPVPVP